MSASLYQGESRSIPRWTIAAVMMYLLIRLTVQLVTSPVGPSTNPNAPFLLRWLFNNAPVILVLALVVIASAIQFGRRGAPLVSGTILLVTFAWLAESRAALLGPERETFTGGTLLFGWLFGLAYARALSARLKRAPDPDRDEVYAEAGAAGCFAAIYLNAAASKLAETGAGWAEGPELLGAIVSRHSLGDGLLDRYVSLLVHFPVLATLFSLATLVVQGGAFLYLISPRLRMLWGTLIIGFHLNTLLLMDVHYFAPVFVSISLSYPWPRIVRSLRRQVAAPTASSAIATEPLDALRDTSRRAARWMLTIGVAVVLLWLGEHFRDPQLRPDPPRRGIVLQKKSPNPH